MVDEVIEPMPFLPGRPPTPRLNVLWVAAGLAYEASAATCDLSPGDRMALECFPVWQYRREAGRSPLRNFGRPHPRYATSRNRSTGVRGRRLAGGEPDSGGGPSVPALEPGGTPDAGDWMGLAWSAWRPLTAAAARAMTAAAGVYRVADGSGAVVYIGQSTALAARLRLHAAYDWGGPVSFSFAGLPAAYTPTQLLRLGRVLRTGSGRRLRRPSPRNRSSGAQFSPAGRTAERPLELRSSRPRLGTSLAGCLRLAYNDKCFRAPRTDRCEEVTHQSLTLLPFRVHAH